MRRRGTLPRAAGLLSREGSEGCESDPILLRNPTERNHAVALNMRREAARAFFAALERDLRADEVLTDKQCVRLTLDKAKRDHAAASGKRFDTEAAFRDKFLYSKIDEAVANWCRKREIKADPYKVFRYTGPERGPTQHETAIGPSLVSINRMLDRLHEAAPEIADCRSKVIKSGNAAIAPAMRLQHPLPFGAAGECRYGGDRKDLERAIDLATLDAATGGDVSRGWRYDCAFLIFYAPEPRHGFLGDDLAEHWDDIRTRIWEAGHTWVILL